MQWCASKLMLGRQGQTEMNSLIVWTWYGSFAGHARRCWPWLGIPAGSRPEYWRNWDFTGAVITNGQRIEKSNIGYPNCQELVHDREKTSVSMCYQYFKGTYGLNDLTHLQLVVSGNPFSQGCFALLERERVRSQKRFFLKRHMTRHELNQRHNSLVFYEYITYGSGIFHSLPCQVRRTWMKHCVATTRSMIAVLLTSTLLAVTQPCLQLARHRCESKLKLRYGQMVARHMFLEVAVDFMTDEIYSQYIYICTVYLDIYIYISFLYTYSN